MLVQIPIVFFFTIFTESSKYDKTYNTECVTALPSEFEHEGYIFSIIDDTNKVSLKCCRIEITGDLVIPTIIQKNQEGYTKNYTLVKIQSYCFQKQFSLNSITIPDTIEDIGAHSFYRCFNLASVKYPSNVFYVPQSCFFKCANLETISLPQNLTKIDHFAFYGCELLNFTNIPTSVDYIGSHAFSFCRRITVLEMPRIDHIESFSFSDCTSIETVILKNVSRIYNYSFYNCTSLSQIVFDQIQNRSLEFIGNSAFSYTALTKIDFLPASLFELGQNCFMSCPCLTAIDLTCNLTIIPSNCFLNCTHLQSVNFPPNNSLTKIENSAFKLCRSIETLSFPESVTEIGDFAFMECGNLIHINFPNCLLKIGQSAFALCDKLITPRDFPPNLKLIGSYAFVRTNTTCVRLPSTVEKVGNNPFKMTQISEIDVAFSERNSFSFQNVLYTRNSVTNELKTVSYAANSDARKVEILNGTVKVGIDTFYKTYCLESVVFPPTLLAIESGAFACSNKLASVELPHNLMSIGGSAFANSLALCGKVYIPKKVATIGLLAFAVTNIEEFDVSKDNDFFSSQLGCLYSCQRERLIQYPNGDKRTEFAIPDNTEIVGASSFTQNKYLKKVVFPSSMKIVEESAFSSVRLETVVLNEKLTIIGSFAFSSSNLKEITFPPSVQSIADNAFNGSPLKYIEFRNCSIDIKVDAFDTSKVDCIAVPLNCTQYWSFFPQDKINSQACFQNSPTDSPEKTSFPFKMSISITALALIVSGCVLLVIILCVSLYLYKRKKDKIMDQSILNTWIKESNDAQTDFYTAS